MNKASLLILTILLLLTGCKDEYKVADEIANLPIRMQTLRFDRDFAEASPEELPELKKKYPYLFPSQYTDSVWIAKLNDTLQVALLKEVDAVFGDFTTESADLELLFKHIRFYFPGQKLPKVVTVTSDVDYKNRIILTDTLLLIGLDNYLGKEHRFYGGIERYIATGLDKQYLTSDVASAFAKKVLKYPDDRSLLAQMIYYGKELYLKDKLIPFMTDAQKIGYTEDQLAWAEANEEQIWRYFIERELLYSTDYKLAPRFLDPAPFSKFRLELDNESPGRLGRYIGWQIVRSFMENQDVEIKQLLNLPADEVFKNARYKPKK